MASWSSSEPVVVNPFGKTPYSAAAGFGRAFANPFGSAFGLEGGSKQFQKRLARGIESGAPTAQYIQQAQDFLPTIMPAAGNIGTEIASRAPGVYNQIQGQIDSFLKSLPGFQQWIAGGVNAVDQGIAGVTEGMNVARNAIPSATNLISRGSQGVEYAKRAVDEAFNPLANSAAYRVASQRALPGITNAAASRGLGGGGAEAAAEQDFLTNLSLAMQQNEAANQQAALGGYTGAMGAYTGAFAPTTNIADLLQSGGTRLGVLGGQKGDLALAGGKLAESGVNVAATGQAALDNYAKQLAASYNIPYEAAQNVMKFITAAQNPRLALLQATAPQVSQTSESKSVL